VDAASTAVDRATLEGRSGTDLKERPSVFVLSPFDPFLIDRRRLRRLFGFDYSIECYLPEAKRRFGYFALPILDASCSLGEAFVGLVDAKADRKAHTLVVKRLGLGQAAGLPEIHGRGLAALAKAVGRSLADYGRFNGADRIVFDRVDCPTAASAAALVKAAEAAFG
jgi:uncharacterized protein YcaQ